MAPSTESAPRPWRPGRLPTVLRADELLDKAFRRSGKVGEMKGEAQEKAKQREMARIHAVANTIEAALRRYEAAFPSFDELPPFYRELLRLLVDVDRTKKSLGAVGWARAQVERVAKQQVQRLRRAPLHEMGKIRLHAHGRMASVVKQIDQNLVYLGAVRNAIRKLPNIDPDVPTIVVAGYPNVGKSSLVRAISTAEPEIAVYPFTTKGVVIGHFERRRIHYQVIDTPGLLDRPLAERNAIERQAILALEHLADVVVFLLDPSEHCGYEIAKQEHLLAEVKEAFDVPIVEVEAKADIVKRETARLVLSAEKGEGVDALLDEIQKHARGEEELPPARRPREA